MNHLIVYGSHNTMTYLPIKNWWLYPGRLIARCQKNNYTKQFENGARVFDLRIYYNTKTRMWEFAHGLIKFKSPWYRQVIKDLLDLATAAKDKIYIRLILERWDNNGQCQYFAELCQELESHYSCDYLEFFGGNRKGDWKKLFTFKGDVPDSLNNQWVSSMADDAKGLEKYIPRLYAKHHNKSNLVKVKEKFNLFDFV